ncbi:FtsX-like permease family protein [Kitasatospora aureofaciens]|uniref:FtsX-like permease family protein n=1 Tax=Kitasatospora aureofaciens TaxID=1894 RepID=UPI001C456C68|nr:FtsX-like permease family protein [Kitasatospora aureofaciens]MBV6699141.1 FtsX-like permease family protein [Kitasatospora aureofaciens]
MSATLSLAVGQIRRRPAAFAGLAVALFLAIAAVTLFGSLVAAQLAAPAAVRSVAVGGPGLMVIAGAFGEIAVLVALFVVVNALGFTLRQQHRDLALLRTIAATPRQVRRLVRVQVAATTVLVAVPGWAAGHLAARWFLAALQQRGMAAPGIRIPGTPLPMAVSLVAALLVGLAATAVAARRISRIAPAAALAASSTGYGRAGGVVRLLAGAGALGGGALLLRLAATRSADELDKAGQAALLGSLVLLVAVALLGPPVARVLAAVLGAPVRALAPGTGWLADANLRGYAARLSSAVVPVALLVGLSSTMLITTRTAEHVARAAGAATSVTKASDVWLRQAELGLLVCFAAVSTVNTLVALTADRRREFALLRLVGGTRRQLLRMLSVEAVMTTAVGVLLGAGVAVAAAGAFSRAVTGSVVPVVPGAACGWVVAGAVVLTVPAVLGSGLRAVGGSAAEVVGGERG